MISLEIVNKVRDQISQLVGNRSWIHSIQTAVDDSDKFYVKVLVKSIRSEYLEQVPPFVGEVRVITSQA